MSIIRGARPSDNFVMIHNSAMADDRLTLRARGLLGYLLSRPPGWTTSAERLSTQMKEGRDAIRAALKELEQTGYLIRKRSHSADGKWSYDHHVTDEPTMTGDGTVDGFSGDGEPAAGLPSDGEPADTNKTEITRLSNKTESSSSTSPLGEPLSTSHYAHSVEQVRLLFKSGVTWHPSRDAWERAKVLYPDADLGKVVIEYIQKNLGRHGPDETQWLSWCAQADKQVRTLRMELEAKMALASAPKPKPWYHTAADD